MDSLIIHSAGAEFWGTFEMQPGARQNMPACPQCGSASVVLKNSITPCYRLMCSACGHTGPRAFAPEWDGRAITDAEACKSLHQSAQAAAMATWPLFAAAQPEAMNDVQHVWRVAMQVAVSLCERIQATHENLGSEVEAHAAARCAQEVKGWQELRPEVIATLLRTSVPAGAGPQQPEPTLSRAFAIPPLEIMETAQ